MKKATWPRIIPLAWMVWVTLVSPASAHPGVHRGIPPGHRGPEIIAGRPGFCVHATVHQEHAWHEVGTWSTNCSNNVSTWHTQYQEYYKQDLWGNPAVFCFKEGWYQSPMKQVVYRNHYPWDIWHRCNNGFNVNVKLYVDSWQYSWAGDHIGYIGGFWRPATQHCHCP